MAAWYFAVEEAGMAVVLPVELELDFRLFAFGKILAKPSR